MESSYIKFEKSLSHCCKLSPVLGDVSLVMFFLLYSRRAFKYTALYIIIHLFYFYIAVHHSSRTQVRGAHGVEQSEQKNFLRVCNFKLIEETCLRAGCAI